MRRRRPARISSACAGRTRRRARPRPAAARGLWFLQAAAGAAVLGVLWFGLGEHEGGGLSGPLLAGLLLAVMGIFEVAAPIMRGASRLLGGVRGAAHPRGGAMRAGHARSRRAAALPADGALELDGLRFAYPDGALVLDGVSLRVAPGERVAIQGESGAGKSTLLHLILRLEDPQAGQVRYGGRDARDCAQADWHRRIALLSQDAPVFLGTLRTNLLIGDPSADEAALWRALDAARLGDFVRGLPDGLDAWAGETGSLLSAGQARRLCLARPCCRRPGCWCWTNPPPAWMRRPRPISCAIWGGRRRARRGAGHACACRRARWTGAACCAGTVA